MARKRDRIYVTSTDYDKLVKLVEGRRFGQSAYLKQLELLEQELDRAEIVEPRKVPRDAVTMNSEVRLRDCETGEEKVYRLVYPSQTPTENSVSVLAPVGTAILGYRAGDIIEWPVPKGTRRIQIVEVLYQPERAGEVPAA